MRCEDVHKEILAKLEGELSSDRSKEMQEHIGSCEDCNKYQDFVSGVMDEIETEKSSIASADFDIRLKAELDRMPVFSTIVIRRVLTPITVAAMVLFGIFAGIKLGDFSFGNRNNTYADLPSEYLYTNEIHLETIESFFLNSVEGEGYEEK